MVRGLSVFQDWFKDFEDQYVLIGGTAAKITMAQEGLNFRGTKDLDIILHIEMLTPEFGQKFWAFVRAGGYQLQERKIGVRSQLFMSRVHGHGTSSKGLGAPKMSDLKASTYEDRDAGLLKTIKRSGNL
jgi:hypothetical protein